MPRPCLRHEAEQGLVQPMTPSSDGYRKEIADITAHTDSYGRDGAFQRYWLGFTEESRNINAQRTRALGELLGRIAESLRGWRILDVGCGDGRCLRALLELDARPEDVVGIDVSDARFDTGKARNPSVRLVKTDGVSFPFPSDHFDLVTQFMCFSNIPTAALRRHTATEMARVLKGGGHVFWWDLPRSTAPTDPGAPIEPADYFDWPLTRQAISRYPRPSETLRYFPGRRYLGKLLDRFGHPPTHTAALIGPKP